jgi:hypothetical protein
MRPSPSKCTAGRVTRLLSGETTRATPNFQVSPGISSVSFLYLDNLHIASFLAQLQGGAGWGAVHQGAEAALGIESG